MNSLRIKSPAASSPGSPVAELGKIFGGDEIVLDDQLERKELILPRLDSVTSS